MRKHIFALAVAKTLAVATLVVPLANALQQKERVSADLNSTWVWQIEIGGQPAGTPTVTLKVDGDKLTGHYSSENFGELDFAGKVTGTTFAFTLTVDGMAVAYEGTLQADDTLRGKVSIPGVGAGTFTGVRKELASTSPVVGQFAC